MKTEKYNNMISAFQCDFSIAREDGYRLLEINRLIRSNNPVIIKDIELLEELEFLLRHGKAEIHLK